MMRIRVFPQVRSDSPLGSRADEVRNVGIAERAVGPADRHRWASPRWSRDSGAPDRSDFRKRRGRDRRPGNFWCSQQRGDCDGLIAVRAVSGCRGSLGLGRESGVVEGGAVAFGAGDAQAEEVAQAAQVAGGDHFVEDAVFAEGLGRDAEDLGRPDVAGRAGVGRGLPVDEEVRIGRLGPPSCAQVEIVGEADTYRLSEQDDAVLMMEPSVADGNACCGSSPRPEAREPSSWNCCLS